MSRRKLSFDIPSTGWDTVYEQMATLPVDTAADTLNKARSLCELIMTLIEPLQPDIQEVGIAAFMLLTTCVAQKSWEEWLNELAVIKEHDLLRPVRFEQTRRNAKNK